jgi:hypothetical protein
VAAVGQRSAIAIGIAALVVAFAIAFVLAHGSGGNSGGSAPEPVQPLPLAPVSINNLERAPSMKPLRSVAGGPVQ